MKNIINKLNTTNYKFVSQLGKVTHLFKKYVLASFLNKIRTIIYKNEFTNLSTCITMIINEIEKERNYLNSIVCSITDLLIITDPKGAIKTINQQTLDLLEYNEKDLISNSIQKLFKEEEVILTGNHWDYFLKQESFRNNDMILVSKSGEEISVSLSGSIIKDTQNNITDVVLIAKDMRETLNIINNLYTTQMDLREKINKLSKSRNAMIHVLKSLDTKNKEISETYSKLKSTNEQLLQSEKMKAIGILAGGVAHDFNNILTTIIGNVNLAIKDADKSSALYSNLEEITTAGERASNLTRQLLLFSRKQTMGLYTLNINRLIKNLLKMINRLIGEDIAINMDLAQDLWNTKADEGNIEQVITNMAVNAKDSMENGGILTIKTKNIELNKKQCNIINESFSGNFICISIEDNGTGMDKETSRHIFEPFFSTKKADGKGTGLGLSVVHGIIKEHNGFIEVLTESGQGSKFDIYLPAFVCAEHNEVREEVQQYKHNNNEKNNGQRIMLIEDESSICKFVLTILNKQGYTVFTAQNGKDALDIFQKEQGNFDLVISDMILPDKKGIQVVKEFLLSKPELNIMFISGYLDDKSHFEKLTKKGYKFLQKPFGIEDLLSAVKESSN
ncbi:response regulator [bacterium]